MIPVDEFWQYSINTYRKKDVKRACLILQDELNANVNVLLFCMYLADKKTAISAEALQYLQHLIQASDDQIKAHREKRKALKTMGGDLYKKALDEELKMERAIQDILLEAFSSAELPMRNTDSFSQAIKGYLLSFDKTLVFESTHIHAINTLAANI
ncbi:TIGR02444 family protein [Agaribacter marinus]|uniref:TIGR02444 family protein n=1 Tax=Agaribacter marinus TaxID=1431249 RepID=A0AA37WKE3_9ALTE|nr:TIGR02444 family protein [Agaribacter marinus]GLR71434.1 hypothetical protein GCM10007852_23420 [Agaribacter marinus]